MTQPSRPSALITGGAKRIGKDIALNLAKKGYDIAISYNNSHLEAVDLRQKIIDDFSVKCEIYQCDISKKDNCKVLINNVIQDFPSLSTLVNNASIFNKSKFLDDNSDFEESFAVHLMAPIIFCKEFGKNVLANAIDNANIINIVDKNIVSHETSYFYYLLSKKTLSDLTKMLAIELAPAIRVNGIAPGYILDDKFINKSKNLSQKIINDTPLKRKGDTSNIVQTVDFILNNNYLSGQILFIDGASSLNIIK